MNIGIGLGYVNTEFSSVDSDIYIRIRKNDVPAKVVKLPFYKK
jgi:aminomethyltransferase